MSLSFQRYKFCRFYTYFNICIILYSIFTHESSSIKPLLVKEQAVTPTLLQLIYKSCRHPFISRAWNQNDLSKLKIKFTRFDCSYGCFHIPHVIPLFCPVSWHKTIKTSEIMMKYSSIFCLPGSRRKKNHDVHCHCQQAKHLASAMPLYCSPIMFSRLKKIILVIYQLGREINRKKNSFLKWCRVRGSIDR